MIKKISLSDGETGELARLADQNLPEVNPRYAHQIGDEVIAELGRIKNNAIRLYCDARGIEISKDSLGQFKLITYKSDPELEVLLYQDNKIMSFRVVYKDGIPSVEIESEASFIDGLS